MAETAGRRARDFRQNIRHYNMAFAFTAVSAQRSNRLRRREHNYIYQVQGSMYHMQGPPLADPGVAVGRPPLPYCSFWNLASPRPAVSSASGTARMRPRSYPSSSDT